jgi:abortive infection bacteriophage resistance protein
MICFRYIFAMQPFRPLCHWTNLSLGSRKWVGNLKSRKTRQRIAGIYDLDEGTLRSFLHHLTAIRNICAHHGRLWNRRVTFTMQIPAKRPAKAISWFHPAADRQVYNTLVMLGVMLQSITPGTSWPSRVRSLVDGARIVDPAAMGFPTHWRTHGLWSLTAAANPRPP